LCIFHPQYDKGGKKGEKLERGDIFSPSLYGKEKNIVMKKRGLRGEDMILGRIYIHSWMQK